MSFVPEPYVHVAHQVLTALTGGVAREGQVFLPGVAVYALEHRDGVLADSVRVVGQAGGRFRAFEAGRDFAVTADGIRFLADRADATRPATGATWPDEGTEFFASYDHDGSRDAPLTDRNVGSLTRTLAEAFARELAVLRRQMDLVYRSGFLDTAEGGDLERVVALLGVTRKSREYASGVVRFFRETPAPGDITIPAGTRVSTALAAARKMPVAFSTTVTRTLRRGQLAVEVPVRAEVPGAPGVVAARAVTVTNQPILGLSGVVNDAPTAFGGAVESDAELRTRARKAVERAGKATVRALVASLTESTDLRENEINVVEDLVNRPGVVKVFVARAPSAGPSDGGPTLADAVQAALLASRPAGVRVEHNLQVSVLPPPSVSVFTGDERDEGVTAPAAPSDDFRLPMACLVTVLPEAASPALNERTAIEEGIRSAVTSYVDASAIGGVLLYNRVVADLMAVPGVRDVGVALAPKGQAAGLPCRRNVVVPHDAKAVIDPADVSVAFSAVPVAFDVTVTLAPAAGTTAAQAREKATALLVGAFASLGAAPDPVTVARDGLAAALADPGYTVGDVAWVCAWTESGVYAEAAGAGAATVLGTGQRPVLRSVQVKIA